MLLTVTDDAAVEDHGTVVVIEGRTENGQVRFFGADHRAAQGLLAAAYEQGEVLAEVEPWQLLGGAR